MPKISTAAIINFQKRVYEANVRGVREIKLSTQEALALNAELAIVLAKLVEFNDTTNSPDHISIELQSNTF